MGGTTERRVDVQLLAATNADLDEEVAARRFRADLLYRLNTVRVTLPPLRRRRDFSAEVRSMLAALDKDASISDDAIERLAGHAWPGNFRELRSVLTRALMQVSAHDPARTLHPRPAVLRALRAGVVLTRAVIEPLLPATGPAGASALQQGASDMVRREFERTGRSVSQTSRNLGISRTTVYRHLREIPSHGH